MGRTEPPLTRSTVRILILLFLGILLGLFFVRLSSPDIPPAEPAAAPQIDDVPPLSPPTPPQPQIPPDEQVEEKPPEIPQMPVRLQLTSFERRDGTMRGSVLRVCGTTDLPPSTLIAYDAALTTTGDTGWTTVRSLPHLREGVTEVTSQVTNTGDRIFCFSIDMYGFPDCDVPEAHRCEHPVHVRARFSIALEGLRFAVQQPEEVTDLFGNEGERIGLHVDCTADCPRLLFTAPPTVEATMIAYDRCPDYLPLCPR